MSAFLSQPAPKNSRRESRAHSLPDPSLRAENSRGFANPFPRKDSFAKPSPHCIRISVLSLWESSVLRTEALQRNGMRLVILLLEKGSRKC